MRRTSGDRAPIIFPPPLLFLLCVGAGTALEYIFPLRPGGPFRLPEIIGSAILFSVSGLVAISAIASFFLHKTPVDPYKSTEKIVQSGPYRFTRNPMYLALLLLISGGAVLSFSPWLFLATAALFLLLDFGVVRREEKYLERKFGQEYLNYKKRVRRWF